MNQSSVIGAALAVAYVIFVINRGELPCWFQVLGIATAAQCSSQLQSSSCPTSSGTGQQQTQATGGTGTTVNLTLSLTNPNCPGRISIGGVCTQGGGSSGGGGGGVPGITIGIGGGGIGIGG